jgi:quinol monooxygenase YgiN
VIVIYSTFDVLSDDRDGFDAWYRGLVAIGRTEKGCRTWDCFVDPSRPERRAEIQVYETEADLRAHMTHPAHVEAIALGSTKWGMSNIKAHFWSEAGGYALLERERTDEYVEGRDNLYELVAEVQRRYDGTNGR